MRQISARGLSLRLALAGTILTALGAANVAGATEQLRLDFRTAAGGGLGGPVATKRALVRGADYYVTVSGTGSVWPAAQWTGGRACGAPESAPIEPSRRTANGPTGWDAETVFAVPPRVRFFGFNCSTTVPRHFGRQKLGGFQIDVGEGYGHKEPIGGARSVPRVDHRYVYLVRGQGRRARFRFFDTTRSSDNYGVLRVVVRAAGECLAVSCLAFSGRDTDRRVPPGRIVASDAIDLGPRMCGDSGVDVNFAVRGFRLRGGRVWVDGREARRFGAARGDNVALRGLPPEPYQVDVRARTTRGQTLLGRRTYLFCLPRVRLFPRRASASGQRNR